MYLQIPTGLLCYRCDSQVSDDCGHYPAPMSSYEDCDEKPVRTYIDHKDWSAEKAKNEEYDHRSKQPLYIRYRYKLCPILEKTIKQYISIDSKYTIIFYLSLRVNSSLNSRFYLKRYLIAARKASAMVVNQTVIPISN